MKKALVLLMLLSLLALGCDSGFSGCGDTDTDTRTDVTITKHTRYIQIEPVNEAPKTCFIFFPGAMIEPADYIDPLQLIAANGYRVLILKPTMGVAILNVNLAIKVMGDFDDIDNWIVGGHSLGGVAAVKAIVNDTSAFDGLILMASYPDTKDDLSSWAGAALSISAENDGLTTAEDIQQSKALLPEALVVENLADFPTTATIGQTIFYEIQGGNHAQFGSYGEQKNDGVATISEAEQHEMIKTLVTRFLDINN